MSKHQDLLKEFGYAVQSARTVDALMEQIVQRLHDTMTRYNWVGFYLVDKAKPGNLVLGPHVGSFEPHDSIAMDRGLCGAAASTKKTVVVNNVAADPRYMAGSELVKSEIVAPVLTKGALYGEIDINSYFANTFGAEDQQFVEACAALVGKYLEKPR
ncbi:MAG TPA: GAF domain-containing protein [Candidatus Angelobacter sp.]|jgi:GAF domain-containing protein|nr:GAF domain-containing protein [Candidatus Angelobacter sp.]